MNAISAVEIARLCGGELLGAGDAMAHSVTTDSRKVEEGSIFIAVKGERCDGHDFIKSAFIKGASVVISASDYPPPDGRAVILCSDTKKALLRFSCGWRRRFDIPVVAVTGSVGKTTTKEFIYSTLNASFNTHKTEGNLNNELGLPLSLLGLEEGHEVAVLEMGMSNFGEISRMSQAACPTIAAITNIGTAHIESLGTRLGIRRAKLEIVDGMASGGCLLLNGDEPLLQDVGGALPDIRIYYFGIDSKGCDLRASQIEEWDDRTSFLISGLFSMRVEIPAIGRHNVYNALCACLCGYILGMEKEKIAKGLMDFSPGDMRQHILTKNGITIIDDCYNANPDSMKAALSVLSSKEGRKVAVLGDMLELGPYSDAAHREIGEKCASLGAALYCMGSLAVKYVEGYLSGGGDCNNARHFDDAASLAGFLKETLKEGDRVLFKGSRGMRMEQVLKLVFDEAGDTKA